MEILKMIIDMNVIKRIDTALYFSLKERNQGLFILGIC